MYCLEELVANKLGVNKIDLINNASFRRNEKTKHNPNGTKYKKTGFTFYF